jgi:TonB family protein
MVTDDHLESNMRRILLSTLLLSPLCTAAAFAGQPANDATASTPNRISTGVTAPRLMDADNLVIPADTFDTVLPHEVQVGLDLNVDQAGHAQNVQVVKPFNPDVDERVVAAVQKFHFQPASLDHQNIPVEVKLTVLVQHN